MPANHDQKPIHNPLINTPKGVTSPIYYTDENLNSEKRFIITKQTDNGAYVRGNLIFYSLNGVEIYAELSDAIYVDLVNKTAMVKKFSKAEDESNTKADPEERQYILMIVPYGYDETCDESLCNWMSMIGRTNTYEYIRDNIGSLDMDPTKSLVITANVKFKDSFTVTQFIDYIKNSNLMPEDDFDIHWYDSEYDEGEEV